MVMWTPDTPESDDPDAWHREDGLFAELLASDGSLLGILSVDLPRDGRRPSQIVRDALEGFGVSAALAIEHARLRARAETSEQLFRTVFEASPVAIGLADAQRRMLQVNDAFCRLLGTDRASLIGHDPSEFTHDEDVSLSETLSRGIVATGTPGVTEKRYLRPDGTVIWGKLRLARISGADGQVQLVAQVEDVTEARAHEEQLQFDVLHDSLTKLPNRTLLLTRLDEALTEAGRTSTLTSVLFCDLDHLKAVNDVHGHAIGDEYIKAVARRIESVLRGRDTVGRIGGDEFVVVAAGISTPTEVIGLAGRLLDAVRQPLRVGGATLSPSMSIGIAYADHAGISAGQLLADADAALYAAKHSGRGSWHIFDAALRTSSSRQLELRNEVMAALDKGQFELHYQPIVQLADRTVVGYEALLRWRHPGLGLLAPAAFLDVIVDSEHESPVTDWVIRQATRDASAWPDGSAPTIAVNLTAFQLGREDIVDVVSDALAASGLPAQRLVVELTEDRLLERDEGVAHLDQLRDLGVQISIDDFGTGFAGLGYVQRLPITTLKIDRSFVSRIPEHAPSTQIVRAVCALAGGCGLRVIAEGVETAEQLASLVDNGVQYAQGYLLGRPQPLSTYAPVIPAPRSVSGVCGGG